MRTTSFYLLICVLMARAACGQDNLDRVFYCTHAETGQDVQEIASVIRSIAEIRQVSVDRVIKSLAVHGTASQIDLAEWLFNELNNPPKQNQGSAKHEYRVPGAADDAVRVVYLTQPATLQQFQELVTMVRYIADIRLLFTYAAPKAVVMRGKADQIAMAEWLFNEVERTSSRPDPAIRNPHSAIYEAPLEYRPDNVIRVFYVSTALTQQDFQELATLIRSVGDIRRLFSYYPPRAIALRGTAAQIALAGWLLDKLDHPAASGTWEYQFDVANEPSTLVRVFYLPQTETVERFQELVRQVRSATGIRRAFIYTRPRAVVMRGSPSQIALADRLFQEQKR